MYIKVYVSEDEKQQLETIASKRKLSLSKLCYEQIITLIRNPLVDSLISMEQNSEYEKCTETVTLHLTSTEYATLTAKAKGTPLSRYIRNVLLYNASPIRIEVYTGDIEALALQVSGHIQHLRNFIAALAIRRQLYENDYQRLISIANNTTIALQDNAKYTLANRKSIRATGVRILRREIKNAVEKWHNNMTT